MGERGRPKERESEAVRGLCCLGGVQAVLA